MNCETTKGCDYSDFLFCDEPFCGTITAMLEKGLVQIYTGDGKGKTTAALGLAVRAAGQGNLVLFYQFLKPPSLQLGERIALRQIHNVQFDAMAQPWDLKTSQPNESTLAEIRRAITDVVKELTAAAAGKVWDVIVLDEIVFCYARKLAALDEIAALVRGRDKHVEIVMTGRGADDSLIQMADLVTEMNPIKHPFEKGIVARMGIEY